MKPESLAGHLVTFHESGHVTCMLCGHTWRMTKLSKKRKCPGCQKQVIGVKHNPYRCHPECKQGICRLLTLDWMICRSTWRAFPTATGIEWRTEKAVPTNTHDLMMKWEVGKWVAMKFWKSAVAEGWVVRTKKMVKPPEGVHEHKHRAYFYNRDKKWRKPKSRSKRPTFIQYYPTSKAMERFRTRFPDAFTKDATSGHTVWVPVYVDASRAVVNEVHPVPLSAHERKMMGERLNYQKGGQDAGR